MKTFLTLFTIGVLLCTTTLSVSTDSPIVLTPNNHVIFSGEVNDTSVAKTSLKLGQLSSRLNSSEVIYLVLDTPGGSVSAGNQFIDFGKALPQKIKPISLFAASMGYHMFQSFDERIVQPSSTLMSHRVSVGGMSGQIPGELITRINSIISISNQMDVSVAKRVGLSVTDYKKLIHDELWLNGQDAVSTNHADRIATIRCSKELLNGTRTEEVRTMFGPVEVTFSACPLITGFLSYKMIRKADTANTYLVPRNEAEVVREIKKAKRKIVMGAW